MNGMVLIMSNNQMDKKDVNVGAKVSLNGLVTAVFGNVAHIKIGGKVIAIQTKDLNLNA